MTDYLTYHGIINLPTFDSIESVIEVSPNIAGMTRVGSSRNYSFVVVDVKDVRVVGTYMVPNVPYDPEWGSGYAYLYAHPLRGGRVLIYTLGWACVANLNGGFSVGPWFPIGGTQTVNRLLLEPSGVEVTDTYSVTTPSGVSIIGAGSGMGRADFNHDGSLAQPWHEIVPYDEVANIGRTFDRGNAVWNSGAIWLATSRREEAFDPNDVGFYRITEAVEFHPVFDPEDSYSDGGSQVVPYGNGAAVMRADDRRGEIDFVSWNNGTPSHYAVPGRPLSFRAARSNAGLTAGPFGVVTDPNTSWQHPGVFSPNHQASFFPPAGENDLYPPAGNMIVQTLSGGWVVTASSGGIGFHRFGPPIGQWPLRQRQSQSPTGSWPLRQKQNGGNTGSWPLRQKQTGM